LKLLFHFIFNLEDTLMGLINQTLFSLKQLALLVLILVACASTDIVATTSASPSNNDRSPLKTPISGKHSNNKISKPAIFAAKVLGLNGFSDAEIINMVAEWVELGIDEVFVLELLYSNEIFRKEIAKTNIKPWLIYQTLFNINNDLHKNKHFFAITENGDFAQENSKEGKWLAMACPNQSEYRKNLIDKINTRVKEWHPHGLSLDFIRYFAFWELFNGSKPHGHSASSNSGSPLVDSCFCETCLGKFEQFIASDIPNSLKDTKSKADWIHRNHQQEWIRFKTQTITSLVEEIVSEVKKIDPTIVVNIHGVPWKSGEYNNAIERITGQDFTQLAQFVDYISPMCYAEMMNKNANWINEVVDDINNKCNGQCSVIPAFQVVQMYDSGELSLQEFRNYIESSLKAPSIGVIFWPWETLNKEQKNIIREYRNAATVGHNITR